MTIFDSPAVRTDLFATHTHRLSMKGLRGTSAVHCSLAPRPGHLWREIKLKPMEFTLEVADIISVGLAMLHFTKEPRTKYFTLTQWEPPSKTLESFKLDLVTGRLRCITKQFSGKIFWPKDFILENGIWRGKAGKETFSFEESHAFQDKKWHGITRDMLLTIDEAMKTLPKRSSTRTCLAILTDDLSRTVNRDALIVR